MTYSDFKQRVVSFFYENLGSDAKITIYPVQKNNNVQLDGLTVLENESNISPTLYLNYYYNQLQNQTPLSKILSQMLRTYLSTKSDTTIDTSFFTDYQKIRPYIAYKLICAPLNENLLYDVPHKSFLDLAIVFYCLLPNSTNQNATIPIRNSHLALWNTDLETLCRQAAMNTPSLLPVTLHDLNSLLLNNPTPGRRDAPETGSPMYILSNSQKLYGAAAMLYPGILESFSSRIDNSFYLLPSSIHEVILLPDHPEFLPANLNKMVREVNDSQVLPQEVLSDHVYYYSKEDQTIKIPS